MPKDTDPNWPKGYPCIVKERYEKAANNPNTITVEQGEEGTVWRFGGPGNAWAHITLGRRNVDGFVPRSHLLIGEGPKVGEVRVLNDLPDTIPISQDPEVLEVGDTIIHKTIALLLATINEQAVELVLPTLLNAEINTKARRDKITDQIVAGIKLAGMFDVLQKPDFSIRDLVANRNNNARDNKGRGVYLINYWDFPNDPRRFVPYTGKTNEFARRWLQHKNSSANPNSTNYHSFHYQIRRASNAFRMVPICIITQDSDRLRTIAEQMFMLMLNTYHGAVKSYDILDDIPDDSTDVKDTDPSPEKIQRWVQIKRAAAQLRKIAKGVFAETKWPGGCGRDSFLARAGANIASPMINEDPTQERVIWTRMTVPGVMAIFRRAGYRTAAAGNNCRSPFTMAQPNGGPTFTPKFNIKDSGPAVGVMAFIVMEITLDGKPHPVPYARIPLCGPWSNWHEGNTLGIRVEWQEKGKWQKKYIQIHEAWTRIKRETAPGALSVFGLVMGLRRFFLHSSVQTPVSWYRDFGLARLMDVTYDHLNQTILVQDRALTSATNTPAVPPTLRSQADMARQLTDAGATKIGGPWTTTTSRNKRSYCDLCYVIRGVNMAITRTRCVEQGETQQCANCKFMNRPCTWTPTELLRANQRLCDTVAPLKSVNGVLSDMGDEGVEEYMVTATQFERVSIEEGGGEEGEEEEAE